MKPRGNESSNLLHRVIWTDKDPNHRPALEFFVFVEPGMVEKWRNDKSVPLVDVLTKWQIWEVPNGGHTGRAMTPSRQLLINVFGTADETEIIQRILSEGKILLPHAAHHTEKLSAGRNRGAPINETRGEYSGRCANKHFNQWVGWRASVHQ
ncbi:hypothetical protein SpCBS45565_g07163 [Spizellomyces sp. 'palustris']|nr:hypothetical protein SpCBS45565_g07163 [Spizellomyces sp. 'palustris']